MFLQMLSYLENEFFCLVIAYFYIINPVLIGSALLYVKINTLISKKKRKYYLWSLQFITFLDLIFVVLASYLAFAYCMDRGEYLLETTKCMHRLEDLKLDFTLCINHLNSVTFFLVNVLLLTIFIWKMVIRECTIHSLLSIYAGRILSLFAMNVSIVIHGIFHSFTYTMGTLWGSIFTLLIFIIILVILIAILIFDEEEDKKNSP